MLFPKYFLIYEDIQVLKIFLIKTIYKILNAKIKYYNFKLISN